MRIAELTLDRFGHFTDQSLAFGPSGASDFHVIYGPNEAGKTTVMEGFLRLLYGFAHREPYDFQHQRKNLLVSAVLDLGGAERRLVRRPTRGASLVDASDTPLPEAVLQAHLGGLGLEEYRKLLCLDDETIERGGQEIAASKGDIGRLLFSAAAGISDLSAVLDHARDEAAEIYKKGGSKSELAQLRKALAEVSNEIRDRDVSAAAYRRLKDALAAATEAEAGLRDARAALTRDHEAVCARIAALPLLDQLNALEAQIAPHAAYPARLEVSSEDLVSLLTDQTLAETEQARLDTEIAALQSAREVVRTAPEDRALVEDLAGLEELRVRDRGAAQDLDRRRATLRDLEEQMRHAARDLGVAGGVDPAALVVGPAEIAALADALERKMAGARAVATQKAELDDLADRISQAEAELATKPGAAPEEADPGAILARFGADGLAPEVAVARQAIASAREAADAALAALRHGSACFETLPDCPVSPAEADALSDRCADLSERQARAAEALSDLRDEAAIARAQADRIRSRDGLIDDATAQAARADREAAWSAHRASLSPDSADKFRAALDHADTVADTRLAQAQALGQLREVEDNAATLATRLAGAEARLAQLDADRAALASDVDARARASGLPAGMAASALFDWVARHAVARQAADDVTRLTARHAAVLDKAAKLHAELAPLIPLQDPSFDDLIAAARAQADRARDRQATRRSAEARAAELEEDRTRRAARLEAAEAEAASAAEAWHAAVQTTFGAALDADTLARSLAPLGTLRELDIQCRGIAHQIETMETDQATFAEAVSALASGLGWPEGNAAETFEALARKATEVAAALTEQARLDTAIATAIAARDAAARRLDEIAARVRTLGAGFDAPIPTATLPDLRAAVQVAEAAIEARRAAADLETRLCRDLGLADMAAVRDALAGAVKPDLEAEAATLKADLARIDTQLGTAIEARTHSERDMSALTGDADVARLEERKATLELEMEEASMRYLELHLGHRLAEEAIRRYRDTHRSTMMAATEAAFRSLTTGRYEHLRTEAGAGGDEILIALDAEGRAKRAEDMSKGTRFQLYLALRAAAFEQLTAQGIRLPFFCDDIFETFDEDRTRAACEVMARIGAQGQAIYLTHHAHVVQIAQEVCGDGVRVHRLGR